MPNRNLSLEMQNILKEALKPAKDVLERDEQDLQAILVKAESLYHTSQFEHALLYFYKGQVYY